MRKPRRTIKVICQDCGITFDAKARSNLRCEKCKKAWANRQRQNYKYKSRLQVQTGKRGTTRPKMSIREVVKAMEKYNKIHILATLMADLLLLWKEKKSMSNKENLVECQM